MTGPEPSATTPSGAAPKSRTSRTAKAAEPVPSDVDATVPIEAATTDAVAAATTVPAAPPEVPAAPVAPIAAAPTVPAAPPVPAAPVAPAAAAPTAPTPEIERPADTGPGAPGAPSPAPKRATPDVAAAVDKAYAQLRERLTVGEIVAGAGALIVLGVAWFFFGWLLDQRGALPGPVPMLLSAVLLAALVLQNTGTHDFGPSYRLIVTGLCLALGFLAAVELLQGVRWATNGSSFNLGGLNWWLGALVAVVGGWMVWREPR